MSDSQYSYDKGFKEGWEQATKAMSRLKDASLKSVEEAERKSQVVSDAPKACANCDGEQLVCEDHPEVPWLGGNGCCGGAGMPCKCSPQYQRDMEAHRNTLARIEDAWPSGDEVDAEVAKDAFGPFAEAYQHAYSNCVEWLHAELRRKLEPKDRNAEGALGE